MTSLGDWSWLAATGNVGSMLLVGPMLTVLMRRLDWSRLRMLVIGLIGWCLLFAAQLIMWRVFGYQAGYPGFEYLQPMALPISLGNFLASLYLTRQQRATAGEGPS